MNPPEILIAVIGILTLGSIVRTRQLGRYGMRGGRLRSPFGMFPYGRQNDGDDLDDSREARRLRDEVQQLKDRIQVLERITVEKENSLAKEIESLRDR